MVFTFQLHPNECVIFLLSRKEYSFNFVNRIGFYMTKLQSFMPVCILIFQDDSSETVTTISWISMVKSIFMYYKDKLYQNTD